MFNKAGYWERAKSGEFKVVLRRNSHLNSPPEDLPFCTHSQTLRYFDADGNKVAVVHQYLLPDNSIGRSGLPDPKFMQINGKTYSCERFGKPVEDTSDDSQ